MRHSFVFAVSITLVALAGCGKAAPSATLGTVPVAPAVMPGLQTAKPGIITSNTANAAAVPAPAITVGDSQYVELDTPPAGTPAELGDDPVSIAAAATEEVPSYRIDERTPYGIAVTERSAKTITIAWRTDLPTRGIIHYGRTWGFDKNAFTDSFRDDVAKTDHKITLTNLRRFTSYTFKITAVTPLGLQFSDKTNRQVRTKFWALR